MAWMIFGHRGAAGHAPENTLTAIGRGLALGASGIEIDVQLSGDGELVVVHDESIAGGGGVAQTSFVVLRQIDLGQGERIPTLDEVLQYLSGRTLLNIEIKSPHTADRVVACLQRYLQEGVWRESRLLLSSFRHEELHRIRALAPQLPLGVLSETGEKAHLDLAVELGAVAVHTSRSAVNSALVMEAHDRGLKLYVYTVNQGRDLRDLLALGVDGVFSDYPERAVQAAREFH